MKRRRICGRAYNRLVTIERATPTPDGSGGQTLAWSTYGTAWVEATPVAGKESLVAGTLHASQPWRFETRFRSDLHTTDRLKADWLPAGHRINIASIADPDGRRERLVMFGTAVQAFS